MSEPWKNILDIIYRRRAETGDPNIGSAIEQRIAAHAEPEPHGIYGSMWAGRIHPMHRDLFELERFEREREVRGNPYIYRADEHLILQANEDAIIAATRAMEAAE